MEVVSGDCIVVADDSIPYGNALAERRVNLSSIRCPKIGNPRKDEKPAAYAREAREFLRTRLIGRQVCTNIHWNEFEVSLFYFSLRLTGPCFLLTFDSNILFFSLGKERIIIHLNII